MKERPILFKGEMVKAILDGRKTQTRRVIKPKYKGAEILVLDDGVFSSHRIAGCAWHIEKRNEHKCPAGEVGDHLWVKENFQFYEFPVSGKDIIQYAAGGIKDFPNRPDLFENLRIHKFEKNYPSIFMPRWASRITLEIINVRIERVQDISEDDAMNEGVTIGKECCNSAKCAFGRLWDSINESRGYGWAKNPWVWVIEFRKID